MHYTIIGNSAAGIAAAREIRQGDPRGRITMISDEPTFGYSRVLLPLYLAGKIRKRDLLIAPRDFYAAKKIRLFRGEAVESIDWKNQRVFTRRGLNLPYDRLLVATGSSPRVLDIPGKDLPGIYYLRQLADAEAIRKDLSSVPGPVLVVGGGLVSVKILEALIAKRKKASLVISSDRILSQMLDQAASDLILKAFEKKGVQVHLQAEVKAFLGRKRLEKALLPDGTTLSCSLALIGKGVHPNVGLLRETGIAINQGVMVDDRMATNLPAIYAAGDVAECYDILQKKNLGHPLWPWAVEGGRIAGSNMASIPAFLPGTLRMNSLDILGIRVVSAGKWEGAQQVQVLKKGAAIYQKLIFCGQQLQGFVLVGDIQGAGVLTALMKNQTEVSRSILEEGLSRGFSYGPRLQALSGNIQEMACARG